mmetsp:Transcript_5115/g.7928  ORF Transcript_5115/g.7928 Transcript_5115/m.7928 type:complete len:220 (+) Transcript_5115:277-936(+)
MAASHHFLCHSRVHHHQPVVLGEKPKCYCHWEVVQCQGNGLAHICRVHGDALGIRTHSGLGAPKREQCGVRSKRGCAHNVPARIQDVHVHSHVPDSAPGQHAQRFHVHRPSLADGALQHHGKLRRLVTGAPGLEVGRRHGRELDVDGHRAFVAARTRGGLQLGAHHRQHPRLPQADLAHAIGGAEAVRHGARIEGAAAVHAQLVLAQRRQDERALVGAD